MARDDRGIEIQSYGQVSYESEIRFTGTACAPHLKWPVILQLSPNAGAYKPPVAVKGLTVAFIPPYVFAGLLQ
jgi:hypothetical protein